MLLEYSVYLLLLRFSRLEASVLGGSKTVRPFFFLVFEMWRKKSVSDCFSG